MTSDLRENETIWLVWNPTRNAPSFVHTSENSAKEEAKRLARLHVGNKFYVMESIGCAEKIDVSYYKTSKTAPFNEDEIPF